MPKPKELYKFTSSYAKDFSENTIFGKSKKASASTSFGIKDFRAILKKKTVVSLDSVPKKKSNVKRKLKTLSLHTHAENPKHRSKNITKKNLLHLSREHFVVTPRKKRSDPISILKEKRNDVRLHKERYLGLNSPRHQSPVCKTSKQQSPIIRLSRHQSPMPLLSRHRSPMYRVSSHRNETKQKIENNIQYPSTDGSVTIESFEGRSKSLGDKPIYCPKESTSKELLKAVDSKYYLKTKITPNSSELKINKSSLSVPRSDQCVVQGSSSTEKLLIDAKAFQSLLDSSGNIAIDDNMVIKLLEDSLISAIKKGDIALSDVGGFSSATSSDTASLQQLHYEEVIHSYNRPDTNTDKNNVKVIRRNTERPATVSSTSHNAYFHKNLISGPATKKMAYKQFNDMLNPDLDVADFFQKVNTFVQTFPGWLQTKAKKKIFNLVIELDVYRRKYGRKI